MDVQSHKITATTAGHEAHGVHVCRRCGWPFPKPHPSAKHRRAHKRVCGSIEGYKIIHSEDYDGHSAISDDDHASDDDEHHTPSRDVVKKNAESSGGVGEKPTKSEDDVFSDAVMNFSDGTSPQLEEHSESVRESGLPKSLEQKSMDRDLYGSGVLELDVEEAADRREQFKDARSESLSKPGALTNRNNQTDDVVPITTAPEMVSVESINDSRPEHEAGIEVQEHGSASVSLNSEEGNVLDQTISAGESRDELCYKFVPEAAKDDSLPPMEASLRADTVEVSHMDETLESIDTSVGSKEESHLTENIGFTEAVSENTLHEESPLSTSSVKQNESTEILDVTEQLDVARNVCSVEKVEMPKTSLDSVDAIEREKPNITGGNENQSLEPKNVDSIDANSALTYTDNAFPCEGNNTTVAKKDMDHCGESTNSSTLETGNEKGEGAFAKVEEVRDSSMPSNKLTDLSSSSAADSDAKSLQEPSENNSSSLAFKDEGFQKSVQGYGADSVVNEISDAFDKSSSPDNSLDHTVSPVTSELHNNIHLTKSAVEIEPVDVAETLSKSEDGNLVSVSGKTPEDLISKESVKPLPDSVLSRESAAKDDGTAEVTAEDHETNVVLREISESSIPSVQASATCKSSNVTSPDILNSAGIITSEEHKSEGKALKSDDCSESSEAPSLKQPLPLPSHVEDFGGISETVDEEHVVNVEDITTVGAESGKTELDYKTTKQTDGASAIEMTSSLTSRSDSLEANCGSVLSDSLETYSQKQKSLREEEAHRDKSDTFEPPSFMTLVQSRSEGDHKVTTATEIETVQNNPQPISDALQAGWFPSLTNVVNESEGRKKNEEIIAKVTNWSPLKQNHGPLKSLLNEVKSPNTKQMPESNQKVEVEGKPGNVGTVTASKTHTAKDQDTNKHAEEWNSPARYPIEIKKEKKGRSFWIPFVCCSSSHRDL